MLVKFRKFLDYRTRERVRAVKSTMEFNLIIIIFLLFSNQIFVFSFLNISALKAENGIFTVTLIISYLYPIILGIFVFTFIFFFIKKLGFLYQSETKYKLAILFVGYRNNRLSNCYQVLNIIFQTF